MRKSDLFSAIVITYNRLSLLTETVTALQRQTHDNMEIIVVNNGSDDGTFEYLNQLAKSDGRVKPIHLDENPWSINDPNKPYTVSGNVGLDAATGDYVFLNFDDDVLSENYAEVMVSLFKENPECTTAVGRTINMDRDGKLIDTLRIGDHRARYMPGHLLALDVLPGQQMMFSSQGCMLTVKRDVLVKSGGFHRSVDLGHLYGVLPFGVTGFDDSAHLYWRKWSTLDRVELAVTRAIVRVIDTNSMLKDWEIRRRWEVFGEATANTVILGINKRIYYGTAQWFFRLVYSLRFKLAAQVMFKMATHRRFWLALPINAFHIHQTRWLLQPARPFIKARITQMIRLFPGLTKLSPRLARFGEQEGTE